MRKLTLNFTGICAFHFNDPRDEAQVLLIGQTGQMAGMSGYMPLMEQGEMHVPCLVAERDAFDDDNTNLLITKFLDPSYDSAAAAAAECGPYPRTMGLVRLERLELTIRGAKCHSLAICDKDPDQPLPPWPDDDTKEWISWVAPLLEIDSDRGTIDESCCAPAGCQLPDALGARVRLTQGRLYTSLIAGWPNPYVFKFSTMDDHLEADLEQAIAEVVTLEVDLVDSVEQVIFRLTDLATGDASGMVTLNPDSTNNFSVEIKNLPLLDVLGRRHPSPVNLGKHRQEDAHFDHFYRLALDAPAAGQGRVRS